MLVISTQTLTLRMPIAQGRIPHVSELDCAFRARIAEEIARRWMEFSGSDNFGELLHIKWFDVKDVCSRCHISRLLLCPLSEPTETLVANVKIPEVDPKIIGRQVCFTIAVYTYRVNMVRMSICVNFARYGSHNIIVECHTRKSKVRRLQPVVGRERTRSATKAAAGGSLLQRARVKVRGI